MNSIFEVFKNEKLGAETSALEGAEKALTDVSHKQAGARFFAEVYEPLHKARPSAEQYLIEENYPQFLEMLQK